MTPERYARVVDLFLAASKLGPNSRSLFISSSCEGDDQLREEVESMLAADKQCKSFLERPPDDIAAGVLAQQRSSMIGRRLGDYEIVTLLGTGGMSEVYLAHDERLGRRAALKVLPKEYVLNRSWLHRFEEEARSVAALNHPNIVTIFGFEQTDSLHFLATEYVEGRTLRELISAGPVSPPVALNIAVQAASALAAAHEHGIVHRDVKPENMILRPDGLLKVLDFGLAKRIQGSAGDADFKTAPGLILGTPRYMSPEQATGVEPDARSDVFSLGCVVYELLSGKPAAAGDNPTEIFAAILTERPQSLKILQPKCPLALVRTIHRALEKAREKRYPTASEMLTDLHEVQRELQTDKLHFIGLSRRYGIAASTVALVVAIALTTLLFRPVSSSKPFQSIAILPFVNEGGADVEYIADGLTDTIIGNLSEVSSLKVTSRSSAFYYKGRQVDPVLAGAMLKTETILLGRILKRGDRILVRLELVDVKNGHRIWGEQYDRIVSDLAQTQVDIGREVLSKLRVTLGGESERNLSRRHSASADAYKLYLKAAYLFNHQTNEDHLRVAIATFHQALAEDPQYALAAAGLANSYVALAEYASPNEAMPKAREYALRAIEMRTAASEAHVALGLVKLLYDWDWRAAEREFKYDSSLTPKSIETFGCYLHSTDTLGRTQEAIATLTRLLVNDPMSMWNNEEFGCATYYARQYDTSLKQSRRATEIQPDSIFSYFNLARAYTQKGMYAAAITELDKGRQINPNFPLLLAERGYVEAVRKDKSAAIRTLSHLAEMAKQRYVDAYPIALVYLGLGNREKAFAQLERAYVQRSSSMPWLKVEPKFDSVRSDPRYIDLLRRVGFTP
jgi:eukaryotic-like serine/threonine-protein kinase